MAVPESGGAAPKCAEQIPGSEFLEPSSVPQSSEPGRVAQFAETSEVIQTSEPSPVPQFVDTSEVIQSPAPQSSEPNFIPNTSDSNSVSISNKPTQLQAMLIRRGILPGPMPEPNLDTIEKQIPYDDYKILRSKASYVLIILLILTFINLVIAVVHLFKAIMTAGSEALSQGRQNTTMVMSVEEDAIGFDAKVLITQMKMFQKVNWMDRLQNQLMHLAVSWLMFAIVVVLRNMDSPKNCIIGYILVGTYSCYLVASFTVIGKGFMMEDFIRNIILALLNFDKSLNSLAQARIELEELERGNEYETLTVNYGNNNDADTDGSLLECTKTE